LSTIASRYLSCCNFIESDGNACDFKIKTTVMRVRFRNRRK
jgi:hypothetical protein